MAKKGLGANKRATRSRGRMLPCRHAARTAAGSSWGCSGLLSRNALTSRVGHHGQISGSSGAVLVRFILGSSPRMKWIAAFPELNCPHQLKALPVMEMHPPFLSGKKKGGNNSVNSSLCVTDAQPRLFPRTCDVTQRRLLRGWAPLRKRSGDQEPKGSEAVHPLGGTAFKMSGIPPKEQRACLNFCTESVVK